MIFGFSVFFCIYDHILKIFWKHKCSRRVNNFVRNIWGDLGGLLVPLRSSSVTIPIQHGSPGHFPMMLAGLYQIDAESAASLDESTS